MADFIGSLVFESGPWGWSEVWYPIGDDYTSALDRMTDLKNLRVLTLPSAASVRPRVSQIGLRGDVAWGEVSEGDYPTTSAMLPPHNCLKLKKYQENLRQGTTYFRGLPTSIVPNQIYAPDAAFTSAMNDLMDYIIANMQLRGKVGAGEYQFFPITSVVIPPRIVSHRVGRPFSQPRGRRQII